jgi:hypothetical protein
MTTPQKQVVVQLDPTQQVVHVTMRPPDMMVWVVQDAQTAADAVANAIAMSAFFMMSP